MHRFVRTLITSALLASTAGVTQAEVADDSRLLTVLERGSLLCFGHNGSCLDFVEVDDTGNRNGVDIDLCRALAVGLFGQSEGNLEIVPISWAQRWPALQSDDIKVVIKVSGWTQSRDTESNLSYSRSYFIGAFQTMAKAELDAERMADLDGSTICVAAGTPTGGANANYLKTEQTKPNC